MLERNEDYHIRPKCPSLNRAEGPRCLATSRDDHASHSENGNPAPITDRLGIRNTSDFGCASHDFASQSFSKVITGDIQH